jgi:hypothetical protein
MLKFELTLDEANTVLGSLGKQPFDIVAGLITKIQEQAQPQLPALEAKMKAEAEAKTAAAEKVKAEAVN